MLPRILTRRPRSSASSRTVVGLAAALSATLGLSLLTAAPAHAANPVTPGNFTGLGFDQCEAPSQSAMTTWRKASPFQAVGIYISGDSRFCKAQKNLTPTWVSNQLAAGWKLMPIHLGPQAWCTTRDRYLKQERISPNTANGYATARAQGVNEANKAVTAARNLGIVPGSTIFYDLEAWALAKSAACNESAAWFMGAWTDQLHAHGYVSGYYSSAASGIRLLDDLRVNPARRTSLPDQIWIADWDKVANTASKYIRADGWLNGGRAKQFQGGHNETWGGVTINIDRNFLDLRTPAIPGVPAPPPPAPAPVPTPGITPAADARCTSASISKASYAYTSARTRTWAITPLQCLLKQQHLYSGAVTGKWNTATTNAVRAYQRRVGHKQRNAIYRHTWVSLLSAGNSSSVLKPGASNADVVRVQRAMNAARNSRLAVNGVYDAPTRATVIAYQRKRKIPATGVVAGMTWAALRAGRL